MKKIENNTAKDNRRFTFMFPPATKHFFIGVVSKKHDDFEKKTLDYHNECLKLIQPRAKALAVKVSERIYSRFNNTTHPISMAGMTLDGCSRPTLSLQITLPDSSKYPGIYSRVYTQV